MFNLTSLFVNSKCSQKLSRISCRRSSQNGQSMKLKKDLMLGSLSFPFKCTSSGTFPSLLDELRHYIPFSLTLILFSFYWHGSPIWGRPKECLSVLISINARCDHVFSFFFGLKICVCVIKYNQKWLHCLFKHFSAKDCYPKSFKKR